MTEEPAPVGKFKAAAGKWMPSVIGIFLGIMVLHAVLSMVIGPRLNHMLEVLPFGWLAFCRRIFPVMEWNWDLVGMALVCICAIGAAFHWLMRCLVGYAATRFGRSFVWPRHWTVSCLVGAMILFLIGTAACGVFNRIKAMREIELPYLVKRDTGIRYEMRMLDAAFQASTPSGDYTVAAARRVWADEERYLENIDARAKYQFYVIAEPDGRCSGHIIKPRDPKKYNSFGGLAGDENQVDYKTAVQIEDMLLKHRDKLLLL